MDPTYIFKGIILKIIIIVFLVKGLSDAKEARQDEEELLGNSFADYCTGIAFNSTSLCHSLVPHTIIQHALTVSTPVSGRSHLSISSSGIFFLFA